MKRLLDTIRWVSMHSRFCISSWRSNCCCRLWGVWPTQPGTQGKPRLCVQRADTTSDFCQSSFLLFKTGVHSFMPYEAGSSRPCRWFFRPVFFSVSAGLAFRSNTDCVESVSTGSRSKSELGLRANIVEKSQRPQRLRLLSCPFGLDRIRTSPS